MENIHQTLMCPICLDYCKLAVECNKCHNLFCKVCVDMLTEKRCALCRGTSEYIDAYFARKIIEAHLETTIKCEICNKCLTKSHFLEHLSSEHSEQLIKKIDLINSLFKNSIENLSELSNNYSIDKQVNPMNNKQARLGKTGKYYCNGRLNEKCDCCDGICGPTTGCNCLGCMELDIKFRRLPKGWLVNREGFAAKQSPETGHFYCGIKCMENIRRCDGYCGPNNGPNCDACRKLDAQILGRYSILF